MVTEVWRGDVDSTRKEDSGSASPATRDKSRSRPRRSLHCTRSCGLWPRVTRPCLEWTFRVSSLPSVGSRALVACHTDFRGFETCCSVLGGRQIGPPDAFGELREKCATPVVAR